jgi:uridine monophosphate synthetase
MAEALFAKVHTQKFDLICGVPYAAIPLATAISIQHTIPLIFLRKELKSYGTKQRIEGVFEKGQRVLLVEDVITFGESVLSAIDYLEAAGLVVEDVAIFTDREQGGMANIAAEGYRPHAVCTLTELVQSLLEEKRIDQADADRVFAFIRKMR